MLYKITKQYDRTREIIIFFGIFLRISLTDILWIMEKATPAADFAEKIRKNVEQVFLGKTAVIEVILAAFFARGHVLLEDVPGTGKTILAR
ncbi:MAG: hypothetical protein FWC45_07540, partial [Treponema sp.]|nr:hypothetical protein [Treponema sp.]